MGHYRNFIPSSTAKNLQLLHLPECVHLTDTGKCSVFQTHVCTGTSCTFCQSYEESQSSQHQWNKRMNSLGAAQQQKISRLYFGGEMPWNYDKRKV